MSHKKRASFALKSMGAAGLAAATIVSGLSFGAAPATAATKDDIRPQAETAKIIFKDGGTYKWPVPGGQGVKYGSASSLSAARADPWSSYGVAWRSDGSFALTTDSMYGGCLGVSGGMLVGLNGTPCASFRFADGKLTANNASIGPVVKADYWGGGSYWGLGVGNGELQFVGDAGPITRTVALEAKVDSVKNIAASAVVSGTASPGAKVSIGSQEVEADKTSGAWSMTVQGLQSGKNDLVVIQKLNGSEVDRKTVSATIVEGGGLFAVDQGPIELERGTTTKVPFVVENRVSRTDTKGTVVLNAPDGTTFSEQDAVQGSWRRVGNTAWNASTSIPLSNGRLSNDNTTLTFDADWASERPADQQYRFMVDVAADADTPEAPSAMEFDFSGTSSTNDFRAQGSTSTTVGTSVVDLTAEVESVDNEGRSAVVTGTATPGADISIGDESTKADATGAWSITVGDLEVGDNDLVVIQKVNGREVDRKTVTATVEGRTELAPITLSGPASVTPGRSNTFTGTAEPGATFRVLNVSGTQIVPGTFQVGADGRWTFDRVVSNGATNFRFVIEQTKNGQTVRSDLFTINAAALAPVTVTMPERVTPGRSNTFTGTAEPGATFRVLNVSGTQIVPGTFQVGADGRWTFDRVVSNGATNFRFVIEQTKNGQTEKSSLFTIEAAGFAPVTVTNRSVTPGVVNTFTGTGEPGASYRVLNITGTQIVPGTFQVDARGNWTFDRAVSRGATEFRFALEQTKNGKTELSELFTLPADTK
ncbi:hypothetical protein [Curtobacterium sp. MCSS17_016]|uniref:hypothetical protein n=1 Tax=Curtobacterium sp. MCSS17_016 TaxID=2175644 RepID=UPI0011B6A5B4|nr:hypothetical protein [Curtobacterium sp. MCSS17_016]WIE79530.1 hypothetical protein DEJ19_002890 [Curtobacterium sp. MCSS17_016]